MSITSTVKDHPYLTAGGVFVLGIVLVIILFSGNTDKQSTMPAATGAAVDPSIVAANTQLAMSQLQQQSDTNQANAALQAALAQTAAQTTVATLQAQAAKDVAKINADANTTVALQTSSLSAATAQKQIDAQQTVALAQTAMQGQLNLQDNYTTLGLATLSQHADLAKYFSDKAIQAKNAGMSDMSSEFAASAMFNSGYDIKNTVAYMKSMLNRGFTYDAATGTYSGKNNSNSASTATASPPPSAQASTGVMPAQGQNDVLSGLLSFGAGSGGTFTATPKT